MAGEGGKHCPSFQREGGHSLSKKKEKKGNKPGQKPTESATSPQIKVLRGGACATGHVRKKAKIKVQREKCPSTANNCGGRAYFFGIP